MNESRTIVKLEDDPRWKRLHDTSWTCPHCDIIHGGIFDIAYSKPDAWQGNEAEEPNAAALTSTHFLSEDFCILNNEHYFVRCVLHLPIVGTQDCFFGYGVWSTLSKVNFGKYVEAFDSGNQDGLGPWFGWFSNRLRGYPDTFNLKCQVRPRSGRQRPYIELEPTDHPLALEQRNGITLDRPLEIYAINGHDLSAALG